ncbi:MAG: alpha/beta hydrolase [Actinobacteria bacterium]|nr:alpha/beta hydrolase [Actinomycetota bacterium]
MENVLRIQIGEITLEGKITIPSKAKGIVLFAHGSGSSRFSPRNNFVAKVLQDAEIATLLVDLLTAQEDAVYQIRFDIDLLTDRLVSIVQWLEQEPQTKDLTIGFFGASTGTAAALRASVMLGSKIKAVVSRGGRPDLVADNILVKVISPTLLIVGGNDLGVIELNEQAFMKLNCIKKLEIVKGATHLFEEKGALEEVARLATDWFKKYLNDKFNDGQ